MVMRSNIRILIAVCLFLGVNWVLINVLPRELIHAHIAPSAEAATHDQKLTAAPQAEWMAARAADFVQ